MARIALANLDSGLFFNEGQWTSNPRHAQEFPDRDSVSKLAVQLKVKNAAAAVLHGDPPQVGAYLWLTDPNPNQV